MIPLLNLEDVFGITRINSTLVDLERYFLDFNPATNETILGFLTREHISSYAPKASFGFTASIKISEDFAFSVEYFLKERFVNQ